MKVLVYTEPRQLRMLDLPDPVPKTNEVLVRIRAVEGVCGSDLHGFLGRSRKRVPPLVLGHQFVRADFREAISLIERKLLPWKKVVTIAQLVHGQAFFDQLASGSSAIMKAVFEV